VPECRWLVGPVLTKLAGLPLCDDPKGVDRTLVHKQVPLEVVAFFDKYLAKTD
jgi:predicted dienelactone hydrolase